MNLKIASNMMILGFSESQRINLMKGHKDVSSTVLGWQLGDKYSGPSSVTA